MTQIRAIRKEDILGFRKVLDEVSRERKFLARFEAPPEDRVRSFIETNVESGHAQFVAEEEGRIVGWCDALPGTVPEGTAHIGRLGMGVLKSRRGAGIGRRLIEATISGAKSVGLEKIELSVYASNQPAIALYRSVGFREEGRRLRGRLVDGIYDDVLLMALDLKRPDQTSHQAPSSATQAAR
jgi:ribosomal protein S18 acetylase RimI-like enzyme